MRLAEPKRVCVIIGKRRSGRAPGKNIAHLGGVLAIERTYNVAKATGIFDQIVVAVDDLTMSLTIPARVIPQRVGTDDGDVALEEALDKLYEETGQLYDTCTGLFALSTFWMPSWIRTANRILDYGRLGKARISLVKPHILGAFCFRLNRHFPPSTILELPHLGFNLDVDYPHQLELAKQTWDCIAKGHIDYPLDENYHERRPFIEELLNDIPQLKCPELLETSVI